MARFGPASGSGSGVAPQMVAVSRTMSVVAVAIVLAIGSMARAYIGNRGRDGRRKGNEKQTKDSNRYE